jgi:hypothetical protein
VINLAKAAANRNGKLDEERLKKVAMSLCKPEINSLLRKEIKKLKTMGKDYNSGSTTTEVGRHYGYSASTTCMILRSIGIQIRDTGWGLLPEKETKLTKIRDELLKREYAKNGLRKAAKNVSNIGFPMSHETARKRLIELGVKIRDKNESVRV